MTLNLRIIIMKIHNLDHQELVIDKSDKKFFESLNKELKIGLTFFWLIEISTLYIFNIQINKLGLFTAITGVSLLSMLCCVFYRLWGYHSLEQPLNEKKLKSLSSDIKFVLDTLNIKSPTRLDVFKAQKTINLTKRKYLIH